MNESNRPVARRAELVVQNLPEETLVYDLKTNEAHCLNKTAAFVWKYCDGNNSVSDISDLVKNNFGTAVEDEFVWLALSQLEERNLLQEKAVMGSMQNRRELIKKVGLASVIALPVIASLVAPTNALASASCACTAPGNCAAQTTCPSTVNCNGSGVCAP
jgi:Coenzyme PQQ synthesis protein D (PqqD)